MTRNLGLQKKPPEGILFRNVTRKALLHSVSQLVTFQLRIFIINWPASWLGGQSSWLLTMRSRVRFPALPCAFFLERGRRPWWPWSGELVEIRFKAPPLAPQIHLSFHHHSHRENVTAPTGHPNLRSQLHFSHSLGGGDHEVWEDVVALGGIWKFFKFLPRKFKLL